MLENALSSLMPTLRAIAWAALQRQIRRRFPQVRQLSTEALAAWLADNRRTPPVLLDVRQPAEYAVSHLRSAQQIDPAQQDFTDLKDAMGVPIAPNRPIVAYCSVGYRSARLVDRLQAAGFTQAMNLQGSIFQWANEGKPVYQNGQTASHVHPYNSLWGMLLEARRAPDRT